MISTPANWNKTTLGSEFDIQQGKSLSPTSRFGPTQKPFLRTSNVLWGKFDLAAVDRMHFSNEEFDRLVLSDGDLLVCEGGDVGRAAVYHGQPGKYAYQNHLHRLRRKTDDINPEFAMHWLRAGFTLLGIYEGIENRTTIPNLSRARLADLLLPKPERAEQDRICHILGTLQAAIDTEWAIANRLRSLKAASMTKLFSEGMRSRPLKDTSIGAVPENWEVVRLGALAKIGNGSTPSRSNESYWVPGVFPWITSTKVHEVFIREGSEHVSDIALRECHLPVVPKGSLVIAITGQGKTLGNTALLEIDTCVNQHLAYVRFQDGRAVPEFFLFWLQNQYDFFRQISSAGGSTKGALTCGFISNLSVPVPEKEEQQDIADLLIDLTRRQQAAEQKARLAEDLFKATLYGIMTGALSMQDHYDSAVTRA